MTGADAVSDGGRLASSRREVLSGALAGAVDGVLLDIDDTLVDTRGAFMVAWRAAVGQYLPHLGLGDLDAVVRTWREDAGGYYAAYTTGRMPYAEQRLRRVNALHEVYGGPALAESEFGAWNDVFESSFRDGWAAFADAAALVGALQAAGVPVGIVTNAESTYQRLKLERVGLAAPPVLVGMDTLRVGKPDARVFLAGAEQLGTSPERTVYVGDELHVDALGAVRSGLRGVWLDRPGTRGRVIADAEIADALAAGVTRIEGLDELLDVLGLR